MLTLKDILKSTGGKTTATSNITFTSVSTDTRTIKKDALYIALIGENHDGHDYIDEAFKKGAKSVIVSKSAIPLGDARGKRNPQSAITKPLILVPDTLKALQDIACFHRKRMKARVVAVTGSSGKTTTKDMIASVLSKAGKTLKTEENLNNEIGVPLTLLKLNKRHKFAVIEMGMQDLGEIEELASVAEPDIAVITNIGKAHLERLKTRMNIAKAKGEVLSRLKKNGAAVLNADDDFFKYLSGLAKSAGVVSFGIKSKADVTCSNIKDDGRKTSFIYRVNGKDHAVTIPLPGTHNIYNALCAVAVAKVLGLSAHAIASGLYAFRPSSKRMDIRTNKKGVKIINDTYNANPDSMEAALKVLAAQKGRRIAVLGDMLELGRSAKKEHESIGSLIPTLKIDILITSGKMSEFICRSASLKFPGGQYFHFSDRQKAVDKLKKLLEKGDVALFKASRGMKFEKIAGFFLT